MSTITPNGTVKLLKDVPFTNNYAHSIYFEEVSDQVSYMNSKVDKTLPAQNYIKEEAGSIRLQAQEENAREWCYMMWENPDLGGTPAPADTRWIYAFITQIDFVSPKVIRIHYEVDVFQTYALFNVTFKECLIERRNVNRADDVIGAHIEAEPVKIGTYVFQNKEEQNRFDSDIEDWHILCFCPYNLIAADTTPLTPRIGGIGAGIFQGCFVNVFRDYDAFVERMDGLRTADEDRYTKVVNSIVSVIAVPAEYSVMYNGGVDQGKRGTLAPDSPHSDHYNFHKFLTGGKLGIIKPGESGVGTGYLPDNKKLYTYPYNMLHVTNNDGKSTDFRYEFFREVSDEAQTGTLHFEILISVQPNFEIIMVPWHYGGKEYFDYDQSIPLCEVPQIPWFTDAYTQWLGSSKIGYGLGLLGAGASITEGIAKGNPIAVAGGAISATNTLGQWMAASHNAAIAPMPYHAGGATAKMIRGGATFYGYQKCVNEEDARVIDEFFTRFGYGVNHIGSINFHNTNWYHHYIKTVGCMAMGSCPSEYLRKIEDIFNNGITIWDGAYPRKIGSYEKR